MKWKNKKIGTDEWYIEKQKQEIDFENKYGKAMDIESVETREVFKRAFTEIENTNPGDVISYGYDWLDSKLSGIFPGQIILIGGESGCLHKDTIIYDPIEKTRKTVFERFKNGKSFNVFSLNKNGEVVVAKAEPPKEFFKAKMYELSDGKNKIVVTGKHRVWNGESYTTVDELRKSGVVLLPTISESSLSKFFSNGLHCKKKFLSFQFYYRFLSRLCGQLLQLALNIFQVSFQKQVYAHEHNYGYYETDDLGNELKYSRPYLSSCHLSKLDFFSPLNKSHQSVFQSHWLLNISSLFSPLLSLAGKFYFYSHLFYRVLYTHLFVPLSKVLNIFQDFLGSYFLNDKLHFNYTKWGVKVQEDDVYYDFTVPKYENYFAEGLFHHNTGKSTFSISLIYNCKKPTAVFALEERLEDYGKKAIYFEIGKIRNKEGKKQYPWNAYVRGELNNQEQFLDYVAKAYENFKERRFPLFQKIDERLTIDLVERRIEILSKIHGIKLFLIDHLHSFDLISGKNSKADFIEDVMVRLGALARKLNISILIVAHYRKLNGNRPTLDAFKDSISIVQNASTVINIWRNREEGVAEEERYKTQFIISKTRDLGGEGKIEVVFDPTSGKYIDAMEWKMGIPTTYDNKNYIDLNKFDL